MDIIILGIIFLATCFLLFKHIYLQKPANVRASFSFKGFAKINLKHHNHMVKQLDNTVVQIENDQEFDVLLQYIDDAGEPTEVEEVRAVAFEQDVVEIVPPERIGVGNYKVTVRGLPGIMGVTQVNVQADARFGEEERLIDFDFGVTTLANEAQSVNVQISEIREQG